MVPHMATAMAGVGQGRDRHADRTDHQTDRSLLRHTFSPILKSRLQKTLDRFAHFLPAMPMTTSGPDVGRKPAPAVAFNFDGQVDNRVCHTDQHGQPPWRQSATRVLRRARMVSRPTFIDRMHAMRELRS